MTRQTGSRAGNRQRLPDNALKACPSCGTSRGNVRRGWEPITRDGQVVGFTCPSCPTWAEPIRRKATNRGRVVFVAVVRGAADPTTGRRKQLKRQHDTLSAAREWVEEVRRTVEESDQRGTAYIDATRLTVRVMCDRWLAARRAEVGAPGGIREVTLNGYASSLHALLGHMGDAVARDVTPGDVESTLRTLATVGGKWKRGLSHRSVVYALGSLRQAYDYGIREGWLKVNPAQVARAPREQHTAASKPTARLRWSPSEVARFRQESDTYAEGEAFAAEPWLRAAMRLTLCGMRRSEVCGLDWSSVSLDVGSVEVVQGRVKTGRGREWSLGAVKAANSLRTVQAEVIHPGTTAALRALWLAQGRPETGLVILDAVGDPVDLDHYSARFRSVCRDAGVPALASIHNVRHSLATALKAADVPDHEAAALLGHDVETYRRFYLVTDDDGAAAAAKIAGSVFAV